jgi:hypothetical protein
LVKSKGEIKLSKTDILKHKVNRLEIVVFDIPEDIPEVSPKGQIVVFGDTVCKGIMDSPFTRESVSDLADDVGLIMDSPIEVRQTNFFNIFNGVLKPSELDILKLTNFGRFVDRFWTRNGSGTVVINDPILFRHVDDLINPIVNPIMMSSSTKEEEEEEEMTADNNKTEGGPADIMGGKKPTAAAMVDSLPDRDGDLKGDVRSKQEDEWNNINM